MEIIVACRGCVKMWVVAIPFGFMTIMCFFRHLAFVRNQFPLGKLSILACQLSLGLTFALAVSLIVLLSSLAVTFAFGVRSGLPTARSSAGHAGPWI